MTPERLAECRECRAIMAQLMSVEPAGRCPEHGVVTLHDVQQARIRDLETQLAAAEQVVDAAEAWHEWGLCGCNDNPRERVTADAIERYRATATQPSEVDGFGDLIGSTPSLPWPRWDATPPSPEVGE